MRIAVNTRLLIENKLDGIAWFTYETLKRITQEHKNHEFIFIFDRPYSKKFVFSDNIKPVVVGPPTRHPVLWYAWFEYFIPKIIKHYQPDVFLSPDGYLPLSIDIPTMAVIHDINFHHRPNDLPFFTRKYYQHFFPQFAQKANRLGTVSEYSKSDLINSYHVDAEKIDVLYNGVSSLYRPIGELEKRNVRRYYSDGYCYFIFVGSLHPRKNVDRLLQAFDVFKKETGSAMKLIVVGEKFFKTKEMNTVYKNMEYQNDVIFIGWQSPGNLRQIMAAATALTFIPLFEGFGIPNIEAMYCDVPVITSNVTSIPEVVGNAAATVNPFSVDEIKEAMEKVTYDEKFRTNLIEKGRERRKLFSWDSTAEKLWSSINKIV